MILIGITGAIGHGKSLLAAAFSELEPSSIHLESSEVITEVANAMQRLLPDELTPNDADTIQRWLNKLPSVLPDIVHCATTEARLRIDVNAYKLHTPEYIKLYDYLTDVTSLPERRDTEITPGNKELYRHILQWYGGFLVAHVDAGIWYNELVRRARVARDNGARLAVIGGLRYPSDAEIIRAAGGLVIEINRPSAPVNDITDPTEAMRSAIGADILVINDGGLDNITAAAQKLLEDITAGKYRSQYHTIAYGTPPHGTRHRLH